MKSDVGRNMVMLKQSNRSQILNTIKSFGPISRKDIANKIMLTPAAVTILTTEMINEGILKEVGQLSKEDKKAGRKKVLVDINSNFKYVLGINIEAENINIGIANLKGEVVSFKTIKSDSKKKPFELLEEVCNECISLLWKQNILKENVIGVGVGVIGPVDKIKGISIRAYGLWDEEVAVVKIIEQNLGLKTVIENNVRALALSEIDTIFDDEKNILFIKYGPGIGAAIIINGEIYYGSCKTAGELGHTIVDLNGSKCSCGRFGCLETVASYKAILKYINSIFSLDATANLYDICKGDKKEISFDKIVKASVSGDIAIADYIEKAIYYFAIGISNTISLFDPNRIVLYGEVFNNKIFLEKIVNALKTLNVNKNIENIIHISNLNNKTNYMGGASLALREFFYKTGGIN